MAAFGTTGLVANGFLRAAARWPDKEAVRCGADRAAYGALALNARRVAAAVAGGGIRRVALAAGNGAAFLEIFLGAVMGGAAAMVMDPAWPKAVLRDMVAAHSPQVLFVSAAQDPGPAGQVRTVHLEDYPRWRDGAAAGRARVTPDMPFLIGFTSGTSGRPKAFIRSHRSWTASFAASKAELGTSSKDCALAPGSLCHGLTLYAAMETLNAGGTIILHPHFDAAEAHRQLTAGEANVFVGVPAMLDQIADAAAGPCGRVERVITAASKLPTALRPRLAAAFPSARVIEYYGASELSFVTVAKSGDGSPPESVGRAFTGAEVCVRNGRGAAAEPGETGVIWVRSAMLSDGYLGAMDGVGFRRDADGWATVGDHGYFDSRGYLHLEGRESDMLITGGHNVYPAEIERVLSAHRGIAACAVLGLPDDRWGHVIAAVAVPRPGAVLAVDALRQACAAALPPYKVPRRWFQARALPRNVSGKVVPAVLRDHIAANDGALTELA